MSFNANRLGAFLIGLALALGARGGDVFGPALRVKGVDRAAMAVAREGTRLYAAAGDELVVLDVSDPLAPRRLGAFKGVDNRRQVAVRDGICYLVSRETGLRIIDCANPRAPRLRARYDSVEFATGVEIAGNVAFLSERINGVEFVDISNPDRPAHIARRPTHESQSSRFRNGYLYSGEWGEAKVTVFDARDMRNIRKVTEVDLHGFGDGLDCAGGFLYCSTGHESRHSERWSGDARVGRGHGLDIFSLADPARPAFVGRADFPRFAPRDDDFWTCRVAHGVAYCADSHNGLFAVDVTNPTNPTILDRFTVAQANHLDWPSAAVSSLALGEGSLYVTVKPGGLFVLPLHARVSGHAARAPRGTPPSHPEFREPYPTDTRAFNVYRPAVAGQARTAVVRGDIVYAAFGDAGLHVLRISPDGSFVKLGELPARKVFDCAFSGERLVTAEGLDGFAVYTLDGPTGFREVARRARLAPDQSVAFWCWAPNDETIVLTSRYGGLAFFPSNDILRETPLLTLCGTCLWDKYLANRSIGGSLPELLPYRGVQWAENTNGIWRIAERPDGKQPQDPRAASQCCGICAFGDKFLLVSSNTYAADGCNQRKPSFAFAGPDRRFGPFRPLPGGIEGVPRAEGNLVALNLRSRGLVSLYDFAAPSAPILLETWRLSGMPDLCAFWRGHVLIPSGHQGLLITKKDYRK